MRSAFRTIRWLSVIAALLLTAGCNLGAGIPPTTAVLPDSGETAAPACQTSATGILRLCVLNLTDGQTLTVQPGQAVSIQAEASGAAVSEISLAVEGETTPIFSVNPSGADPLRADLQWIPAGGSKRYQLRLQAITADKSEFAEVAFQLQVEGLPAITAEPTLEAGAVPQPIQDAVVAAYLREFGLTLPFPAIARKNRPGVEDPWVSTAYVGPFYYEVVVFPDGRVEAWTTPLSPDIAVDYKKSEFKDTLCRPAGEYTMLVVFLDFGNLPVTEAEILADLEAATRITNQAFAAYLSAGAGSAPILQLRTTGVVIPVPPDMTDHLLTMDQIRQYALVDPAAYRWVTQVDLDSARTARMDWGGMETISFGYAYAGCPKEQTQPNIWVNIDDVRQLVGVDNQLSQTLEAHEVYHLFGLPGSHIWACTDGPQADPADICGYMNVPGLLLGWVDVDRDGIPEILDPSPYGMPAP